MKPDPHLWAGDLSQLHAEVWLRLTRGVHDRHAPARHPTLATVTPDGRPQARTVVLRAANKLAGTLDIHTDLRSAKVQDLRATPFAALHVWDASAHLQLRLEAQVTLLTSQDVVAIWAAVPEASKLSYGGTPAPGKPIAQALAYTKAPDPACFAVLRLSLLTIDMLHLGPDHRRARFDRTSEWAGEWLAP
ncbi:MAG: pyridoxamine 5'-phosphate oxidase family protein [Candidatus Saccharibacteria bacterium]|nr:pyridoxamine 5'-phosphate oxidase family protein [Pseudorhodobacter sp.]